jgi:hypothetical protein
MTELERALVALGAELEFPPEPNLVAGVRARLERRRLFLPRRRALAFVVALLVVAFGIAMAVPDARSAILRFFHIGAVTVEEVETLPAAKERPLTAGLGPALSRREAERRFGFSIRLPDFEGAPPTRYYTRPGLIATLFHSGSTPVLLVEIQGDQTGLTKKLAGPGTRVEGVELGQFGLWLEGGKHVLRWGFGRGEPHQLETRLAGNVLIWLVGETTFRLEGDLDKSQMLKLARQITR